MRSERYWLTLFALSFSASCLWKSGFLSWPASSGVRAKASIRLDLSLPATSMVGAALRHGIDFNRSLVPSFDKEARRMDRGAVSQYMLQLYHRRPDEDVVRAIRPSRVSARLSGGARILEFSIPAVGPEEILEAAELLGTAGTIFQVRSADDEPPGMRTAELPRPRKDDSWRAFNVTAAVAERKDQESGVVRLRVRGRLPYYTRQDGPILLLSYSKSRRRRRRYRRSTQDQQEENEEILPTASRGSWEEEGGPRRRRRTGCRRRPLYVDFALIAYDEWVVAPPGYEAYQCAGKCFYPFGDHLNPTKHAIVQTLVHGALQTVDGLGSKSVGRACCVPTRLAPTSLLYLDDSGTLTYQYGYEDMVVAECGCR